MEREDKTNSILRQFKKKSRRIMNQGVYTEFFYLNKNRQAIEFLVFNSTTIIENFFKAFLPEDFRDFIKIKLYNDEEEKIKTWFYEKEDLVIVIEVNWGFKKQEISIDIDIDSFILTIQNESGDFHRKIDHILLNDYIISFLTNQAKTLAQSFEILVKK